MAESLEREILLRVSGEKAGQISLCQVEKTVTNRFWPLTCIGGKNRMFPVSRGPGPEFSLPGRGISLPLSNPDEFIAKLPPT